MYLIKFSLFNRKAIIIPYDREYTRIQWISSNARLLHPIRCACSLNPSSQLTNSCVAAHRHSPLHIGNANFTILWPTLNFAVITFYLCVFWLSNATASHNIEGNLLFPANFVRHDCKVLIMSEHRVYFDNLIFIRCAEL